MVSPYQTHPARFGRAVHFFEKNDKVKILSLVADRGGCGWYRVRQAFAKMERLGMADMHIFDHGDKEHEMRLALEMADIILARNGNNPFMELIRTSFPDKRVIFDHDDNSFVVPPSSEHYRELGTDDVYTQTEKGMVPVWVTGLTPDFDKFKNRKTLVDLEFMLEKSDMVTTTTDKLAEVFRPYNSNTKVIYNCINPDAYPDVKVDSGKGNEIRIGWQGGVSHMGDFREVGPLLSKVMKKNKNAYFYSLGSWYPVFFKGVEMQCRVMPWVDFQAHSYRMKCLDLDVAVIPLQEIAFNDFKSEIKFSEFAALRVPCLVKRQTPYMEVVQDGVTGMMYSTDREFTDKLERLMKDAKLRKLLSDNAYDWVMENRNLDKYISTQLEIYKSCLTPKSTRNIKTK